MIQWVEKMTDVKKTLSGVDNKRLQSLKATNKEGTAAWANGDKKELDTNVYIPAEYSVEKAKNWVDNGSQL